MKLRYTRRTFLAVLAAGTVGATLGLRLYWSAARTPVDAERLVRLLPHADSAARLGRLYLEGAPQEADTARLAALIGVAPLPAATDEVLRECLEARIREDFIDGATVAVDGWLLSVTEARLCALLSLLRDGSPAKPV